MHALHRLGTPVPSQVPAAVFGAARWASLDDLLLHAALGLEGARVLRLLHEEEWEAELEVQHTLMTAASILLNSVSKLHYMCHISVFRIKGCSGARSLLTSNVYVWDVWVGPQLTSLCSGQLWLIALSHSAGSQATSGWAPWGSKQLGRILGSAPARASDTP